MANQKVNEKGEILRNFLNNIRVKKGEPFTHTTKSPAGSYYVGEDSRENFMTVYSNAINAGVVPTVTEKPGAYGPLRFDFDLKSSLDDGTKRKYSEVILKAIIKFIMDELKHAIDEEKYDDFLVQCIVLEKKAPRVEEGIIKDGFHLHFPHFVCEGWFQDEYLRTKIIEKMVANKTWENIRYIEPVEKYIDINMAKKQWLMYGSAKAEKAEPFLATRVYDANLNSISLEEVFVNEMANRKNKVNYYLPRFMSIQGYAEPTPLKHDIENRRMAYKSKKTRRGIIVKKRSAEDVMEDIKTIKDGHIMEMLSDERADSHDQWMDVGWTLFNIGQGCDDALQLWIDFSRRSVKFVEGECEEKWAKMEMRDKTIGSLLAMAKTDNPDEYKQWRDTNIKNCIERSLYEDKPNEWDVAQVIYKLYKDRFLCADAKRDLWYEFMNHKWNEMDDGIPLKLLFATDIVQLYYEYKAVLADKQQYDKSEREKLEKKEEKCRAIITALKTVPFQERLIKMCKVVFHNSSFLKKVDENKLIFVCSNGVLDLELFCFRDGRPDDFATLSCNVVFPKDACTQDDEVMEVEEFLHKVFPNENRRKYFKDTASAALEGGNVNKTFIVGTGDGNNGKSVTYSFLQHTFGDYCINFPRGLLVMGKTDSSGAARPELARVRGKRLAIVSEIAKTETFNIGVLKELTGNDSFFARGVYEKGTDIRPMFTLFMQCLSENTQIPLPFGFSMPLKQLSSNSKVLAWDSKTGGIKPVTQKKFLDQGTKECLTVTLKDGTNIVCTPDHRLLTADGEWIEAKDIIPGDTELMMGVHQPYYDDLKIRTDYKFLNYNLNKMSDRFKAMAVCRLLGYGLADGSTNSVLYIGHMIDVEQILDDIYLLTDKKPKIYKDKHVFVLNIPAVLTKMISKLCPPQPGGRINNPMILPKFIFDQECPNFLVREVLAGMFGGDGVIPCVAKSGTQDRKMFSPLRYIASKINKYIPSLQQKFGELCTLLWDRFGIEAYVEKPLEYIEGKSRVQININKIESVKSFIEQIGVRYCCHKAYRLTAVLSYYKYKTAIAEQNENIVSRVKDLVEKYNRQNPLPKIQQYTKDGNTLLNTFDTTQTAQHATGIAHGLIQEACIRYAKTGKGSSKGYVWKYLYDVEPTVEDEPGCITIKDAFRLAVSEQPHIHNVSKIVTYTQLRHRILKGEDYTQAQTNDLLEEYLMETGLDKFCNCKQELPGKTHYSVGSSDTTLPTYKMKVIGVKDAGKHQVYDLTIEEPYSNYMSNGMISHNCNEPPKVPGHDEATWNRIRVLDYESKFVIPKDLHKYPVPKTEDEQFEAKRFHADVTFTKRLPELAPYLLWVLFNNYKEYKKTGLIEPKEVQLSTNLYRAVNDVYLQFIDECIRKVPEEELKNDVKGEKYFIKLGDLHAEFTAWYHENHSSYAKEKFSRITLLHEFNKRFPGAGMKKGKIQGWYGYELVNEDLGTDEKGNKMQSALTRKLPSVTPTTEEPKKSIIIDDTLLTADENIVKPKITNKGLKPRKEIMI